MGMRCTSQQLRQGTGVIGLQMIEHDVFDLSVVHHRLEAQEKVLGEFLLHRVDDGNAFAALDQIGIIGSAIGGAQDDIEVAQRRVEGANPKHAIIKLYGLAGTDERMID